MRRRDLVAIVAAGIATFAALAAIALRAPRLGSPEYEALVAVACAGYAAALGVALTAGGPPSRRFLRVCLLLAVAFRVPLWTTGPGNDVYRYVWDARLQRAGISPYAVAPADPAVAALHTDETRRINHPDLPTPYPPGAQLLFRLVYHFGQRAYAFKIALAVCDFLMAAVIWLLIGERGGSPSWILVYAWNPLVILVTAGEGHIDLAGALCVAASVLFLVRGRRLTSALCFALAVAIKPLPIVLLPLYWRRVRAFDAAVAALFLLGLSAPYMRGGALPIGSLSAFVDRFRFNDPVFAVSSAALGARGGTALAVLAGLALAAFLRFRTGAQEPGGWAWPMAVALAASPVVYPWYLVWLVPFATTAETLPLLAWSVTVLSTYQVWHLADLGGRWTVPPAVLIVEFGVVLAVGAAVAFLRWRAEPETSARPARGSEADGGDAMRLSVLVPAFNEASIIGSTLERAAAVLPGHEIVVIDAESTDQTEQLAAPWAAVVRSSKTRGAALTDAVRAAHGDVVLFLHADTLLPANAEREMARVLRDPAVVGGAFRFGFDEGGAAASAVAAWVNMRSRAFNVFFGDQALFVRRDVFLRAGGFRDWNLMEDLEILPRLRRFGYLRLCASTVVTSARRHRQSGWLTTMGTVWLLTCLHFCRVPARTLAHFYRPDRPGPPA